MRTLSSRSVYHLEVASTSSLETCFYVFQRNINFMKQIPFSHVFAAFPSSFPVFCDQTDECRADPSEDSPELSNASLVGAVDTQGQKGREPWLEKSMDLLYNSWMISPVCYSWLLKESRGPKYL